MAYTTIDDPEAYFQVKLWSGTGSSLALTFDGDTDMSPDLIWIKSRSRTDNHTAWDTARGTGRALFPNKTAIDESQGTGVTAFGSDGFTVGALNDVNYSSATHVAWCWSAGTGAGSANTDGSINTTSTSVNTTSKFSISKYTGTGGVPVTIGHGLGVVPTFIMIKKTDGDVRNWAVYHQAIGNTHGLILNTTSAKVDNADIWNDTTPTSTLITFSNANETNQGSAVHVAYAFSDVQGFSKFGSYIGNGNADGIFTNLGFRPAFIIIKISSGVSEWVMFDNKRVGYNTAGNEKLYSANTNVEADITEIDLLSNGFKLRSDGSETNTSGSTYVYMAFAEAPFVNSKGVPCNAR